MIRIVGLDASIASTGIARADIVPAGHHDSVGIVEGTWTGTAGAPAEPNPTVVSRVIRLGEVADAVDDEIGDPDLIVIEGPAPGLASNRGGHDLSGVWWLILDRYVRRRRGRSLDVLAIAPSKLAKFLTGNGGARKPAHVEHARKLYGDRFDIPHGPANGPAGDISDAVGLVAMGARFLGLAIEPDHPLRIDAMVGVSLRKIPTPPKPRRMVRRSTTPERITDTP